MRKIFLFICLAAALCVQAATAVPDVGNGRLRVLGNNLQNYYYNYNTGRGNYTDAERAEKTRKIVIAMLQANADIYAFCEVEAQPIVLQQLADSMNAYAGVAGRYATVEDGIEEEWDATYNNNLKSGFIYRTDKVEPYSSDFPATNVTYYKNVMRIQAWTELSTNERFTLSMNHFKAMSDDASIAKRVDNANWLVSGLNTSSKVKDPDILIMGDLNAQMSEECISIIQNASFTEQLVAYNANAYTYCYNNSEELIDHVFANSTMATQITGAAAWHYNTTCESTSNYANRYSDHDPYLVAINLGGEIPGDECTAVNYSEPFSSNLGEFTAVNVSGDGTWYWNSNYSCANANAYNKGANEDYLVSPAFDFTDQKSGTISFTHALGYGTQTNWPTQCKLLISDDYTNDVTAATWTELTISNWSTSNFNWQTNLINIPAAFMRKNNVHFAFYYNVGDTDIPSWEIKDLLVSTVCEKDTSTGLFNVTPTEPQARKEIRHGQLIIIRGGEAFTVTGQRVY